MVQPSSRDAGSQQAGKGNIVTGVDAVPVTLARRPPEGLDNKLPNPGLPRANLSVDAEHPDGTYAPPNMTVLQQHVAFWDPDRDGVIWPMDTFRGFRKLGFNPLLSFIAIPMIHGTFSWWTCPSWIPDPFLRIWMDRIHKTKHGSDSETYDTEGRFVPEKFEEVFSKYDKDGKGGLKLKEVNEMVCGNRNIMDPVGWFAEWLEWNTTFYLAAKDTPHGRVLTKDDARGAIDGTLFYRVAREVEAGRLRKRQLQAGLEKTAPTIRKEE